MGWFRSAPNQRCHRQRLAENLEISQAQKRATEVALFYGLTELSSVFPSVHAAGRPEW